METKKTSFWSNPWLWGGCGCGLGCLAIPILFFLFMGGGLLWFATNNDIKDLALDQVRANRQVVEALGEPIESGFGFQGNLSVNNDGGVADMEFSVEGPKGDGTVAVRGDRADGRWTIEELVVTIEATGERIEIVPAGGAASPAPPAEENPTEGSEGQV
jgi:hypothetical protein